MRISGIHLQGIRAPRGEHRLALDPGYNAILTGDVAGSRAFVRLVETLLYPDRPADELASWIAGGDTPARAGLAFSLGSASYRLILDLDGGRVLLGRYDAEEKRYRRETTDPGEVEQLLRERGLPELSDFRLLYGSPLADDLRAVAAEESAEAPLDEPAAPASAASDGERAALEREVDRRAALGEVPDLAERVDRFREARSAREGELASVEAARRGLLDQRARLRGVPAAQSSAQAMGVALGAVGAVAGALVQPWFYAAGLLGVGWALFGLLTSARARRGLGRVEARLAGLRVREASIERRFESETGSVRSLLQALGVGTVEELEEELVEWKRLSARLEETASGEAPLGAAQPEPASEEPPTPVALPVTRTLADEPSLDELLAAAVRAGPLAEEDLRARVVPVLPIYLRALAGTDYARLAPRTRGGWSLHPDKRERVTLHELPDELHEPITWAVRLALIEAISGAGGAPLLIGPDPFSTRTAEERVTLARALKRLGGVVQVLHFGPAAEAVSAHAAVQELGA